MLGHRPTALSCEYIINLNPDKVSYSVWQFDLGARLLYESVLSRLSTARGLMAASSRLTKRLRTTERASERERAADRMRMDERRRMPNENWIALVSSPSPNDVVRTKQLRSCKGQ